MVYVKYDEALDFLDQSSEKIKVVIFGIDGCTTCDDFIPDVLEVMLNEKSDDFEYVNVDVAEAAIAMKFPPTYVPVSFFFIPNLEEEMPLFRQGGTTPQVLENDLNAMVEIKNKNITLDEAFSKVNIGEVTSWVQRQMPL